MLVSGKVEFRVWTGRSGGKVFEGTTYLSVNRDVSNFQLMNFQNDEHLKMDSQTKYRTY